jgi:hypothetical protein
VPQPTPAGTGNRFRNTGIRIEMGMLAEKEPRQGDKPQTQPVSRRLALPSQKKKFDPPSGFGSKDGKGY